MPSRHVISANVRFASSGSPWPRVQDLATAVQAHVALGLLDGLHCVYVQLWRGKGQTITLSELRGRPVVLAFYPADWSPVCGDQMALYNQVLPEFGRIRGLRVA